MRHQAGVLDVLPFEQVDDVGDVGVEDDVLAQEMRAVADAFQLAFFTMIVVHGSAAHEMHGYGYEEFLALPRDLGVHGLALVPPHERRADVEQPSVSHTRGARRLARAAREVDASTRIFSGESSDPT